MMLYKEMIPKVLMDIVLKYLNYDFKLSQLEYNNILSECTVPLYKFVLDKKLSTEWITYNDNLDRIIASMTGNIIIRDFSLVITILSKVFPDTRKFWSKIYSTKFKIGNGDIYHFVHFIKFGNYTIDDLYCIKHLCDSFRPRLWSKYIQYKCQPDEKIPHELLLEDVDISLNYEHNKDNPKIGAALTNYGNSVHLCNYIYDVIKPITTVFTNGYFGFLTLIDSKLIGHFLEIGIYIWQSICYYLDKDTVAKYIDKYISIINSSNWDSICHSYYNPELFQRYPEKMNSKLWMASFEFAARNPQKVTIDMRLYRKLLDDFSSHEHFMNHVLTMIVNNMHIHVYLEKYKAIFYNSAKHIAMANYSTYTAREFLFDWISTHRISKKFICKLCKNCSLSDTFFSDMRILPRILKNKSRYFKCLSMNTSVSIDFLLRNYPYYRKTLRYKTSPLDGRHLEFYKRNLLNEIL